MFDETEKRDFISALEYDPHFAKEVMATLLQHCSLSVHNETKYDYDGCRTNEVRTQVSLSCDSTTLIDKTG